MKRISRIVAALLAVVLLALSLSSCAAARPVYASPRASKVVATVGDVEILYEELYFITMNYIKELKLAHGENAMENEAHRAELERFVWESLRSREAALISLGYLYGLDVYEGDIKDSVSTTLENMLKTQFGGDRGAYIEALATMHLTDHYMRKYIAVSEHLANAIVLEMLHRGELVTDDVAVLATINSDAFIRTVHVFIDKTSAAYTEEQHREHAFALQAEVAAATTDAARFDAMCEAIGGKYNADFGDPLGNGYYFTHGEMNEAYEAAAFALTEYGVSEVLEIAEGYYIIMRLPKDEAYIRDHFETLKNQSYYVTLNKKVEEKLSGMTLQKTKFGESLMLAELSPIDPDGGSTLIVIAAVTGGVLLAVGGTLAVVAVYRKRRKK